MEAFQAMQMEVSYVGVFKQNTAWGGSKRVRLRCVGRFKWRQWLGLRSEGGAAD